MITLQYYSSNKNIIIPHTNIFIVLHYYNRIIKNIFNKNGRCRNVKTQKVCEQGREVNIGPKIKQTTSIQPYISTYTAIKQNTKNWAVPCVIFNTHVSPSLVK